jgi:hypothetical protein
MNVKLELRHGIIALVVIIGTSLILSPILAGIFLVCYLVGPVYRLGCSADKDEDA